MWWPEARMLAGTVAHPPALAWDGRSRTVAKGSARQDFQLSRPRRDQGTSLSRNFLLLHIVGQFGELQTGGAECLRGMLSHCRDHLVVQILDELGDLFLDAFGSLGDGLANAR